MKDCLSKINNYLACMLIGVLLIFHTFDMGDMKHAATAYDLVLNSYCLMMTLTIMRGIYFILNAWQLWKAPHNMRLWGHTVLVVVSLVYLYHSILPTARRFAEEPTKEDHVRLRYGHPFFTAVMLH